MLERYCPRQGPHTVPFQRQYRTPLRVSISSTVLKSPAVGLHNRQVGLSRSAAANTVGKLGATGSKAEQRTQEATVSTCDQGSEQPHARRISHYQAGPSGHQHSFQVAQLIAPHPPPARPASGREWQLLAAGAFLTLAFHVAAQWISHLPIWQRLVRRFIWWKDGESADTSYTGGSGTSTTALTLYNDNAESVEWFNMCWRKMWRVYQRGLERWLADLLQPVFDNLVAEVAVPRFLQRLRILEFTLDHEAPTFSQMRRRSSRKDSDLNGVVNVRYTGGARMLLLIEVGQGRWRFKLPVLVSDLDLECKLWIKLCLAPMTPYIGTISLAFVGPPTIKVQLLPYNHVRLMRIPVLQPFLSKLLTVDLPNLMVLPKRLEINIPPAVTAVAEAAVGHDAVMRAVASAVLQADAMEHALMAALPLGPQSAAGGISLPDSFHGELQVSLLEARDLPVWGFPWQSNPYCRLVLGSQAVRSRRDDDTSHAGSHRAPVWNQEFQFLVEDPMSQVLEFHVRDSHLTGRADLGYVKFPLRSIPAEGHISTWLPVQPWTPGKKPEGQLHVKLTYKPFEDDESNSGYREAEAYALMLQEQAITDIKSAADASSRAAVAASAAAAAVAVTKAAAARAAAKVALSAKARARQKRLEAAEQQEKGGRRLDRRASKKDRVTALASGEGQALEDPAAADGAKADDWQLPRLDGQADVAMSSLDQLALQDISPEDLFPPVSFSISEKADEDMPYTKPPATEAATSATEQAGKEKPASSADGHKRSDRSESRVPSHRNGSQAYSQPRGASGEPEGRAGSGNGAKPESSTEDQLDRRRAEGAAVAPVLQLGEDLPLVLSTLENASVQEALSLDSDIAGVVEAVANGDIQAFADGTLATQAASATSAGQPSVGRGPLKDKVAPPAKVDAVVEFTVDETASAESEAAAPRGKTSVGLAGNAGAAQQLPVGPKSWTQSLLSKLPFLAAGESDQAENVRGKSGPELNEQHVSKEQEGEREDRPLLSRLLSWRPFQNASESEERGADDPERAGVDSIDEDTIKDVVVDDLQLEAIAEEVQNSWRLKEIRTEAIMQKAVARSERPWLILLSSLFSSTVVLLALVLYRLWNLDHGGGGLE